ncbi:MAG: TM2 domain-containing protein [Candidatus Latescibacteria bacterium]|nr:TM2 domain-containing protein [Candidatus Latescibacterota bacterium]MCK5328904.1 TM2 domain-containing protein [Candidatus Latescibacterota bacterium]MCK5382063.1 TM2 domain-containing protein [Candidatus Latescibacterota bacterium]MCK5733499.1 TM2 domain-containing protein [Candidatus Latescibacterota bacterium]
MLKAPKRAWRVESNSFRKEEAVAEAKVIIVRREKSKGPAYLLLIFLGQLGIHRFYLGKVGSGIAQLLLFVLGLATMLSRIGPILLVILWIWLLIDLFLTASMVRKVNAALYGDGAA